MGRTARLLPGRAAAARVGRRRLSPSAPSWSCWPANRAACSLPSFHCRLPHLREPAHEHQEGGPAMAGCSSGHGRRRQAAWSGQLSSVLCMVLVTFKSPCNPLVWHHCSAFLRSRASQRPRWIRCLVSAGGRNAGRAALASGCLQVCGRRLCSTHNTQLMSSAWSALCAPLLHCRGCPQAVPPVWHRLSQGVRAAAADVHWCVCCTICCNPLETWRQLAE